MKVDWTATAKKYKGRTCAGGIDLSSVSDLTCWVIGFPRDDDFEAVDFIMRCWCPESRLFDKQNKYRDQYQAWEQQGWLEVTEGNAIDYEFVRARIVDDVGVFKVDSISIDRLFQGYEFAQKLNDDMGGTEKKPKVFACGMGYMSMGPLCQEFERRLLLKKLNHGGNPVLRFMADSVSVTIDPTGSKKPNKDKSQGKIDGIIGMLLVLDRLMRMKPVKKPIIMPT